MKNIYWFLLIILPLLTVCEKDPAGNPDSQSPLKLLTAIKENGSLQTEFLYDSLNRMIRMNMYNADTISYSELYTYNSENNIITRSFYDYVEYYTYSSEGDLLSTRRVFLPVSGEKIAVYQYHDGKIFKAITYLDGEERGYILYKYDIRGNTIERNEYYNIEGETDFLDEEFKLSYDDKINPLRDYSTYPVDMTRYNNPVLLYHSLAIMCSLPREIHISYEYDEEGYPVKEFRDNREFEYVYREP